MLLHILTNFMIILKIIKILKKRRRYEKVEEENFWKEFNPSQKKMKIWRKIEKQLMIIQKKMIFINIQYGF